MPTTSRKKEFARLAAEYTALADHSDDARRVEAYRSLAQGYRLLAEVEAQLHPEPGQVGVRDGRIIPAS